MGNKEKVILAFSGGLDTTFCLIYLIEQGYDVVTVTVNTGGLESEQAKNIEKKAWQLGSKKHYTIDAREKIYAQIVQYIIKFNAKYENDYPLLCADRYVIAQELLHVAHEENTHIIAHGCTANGNDQVRFDTSLYTLKRDVKVNTPVKTLNITRDKEVEYLNKRNIKVENSVKAYSINENILGITYSGSEVDENREPNPDIYQLTKVSPDITAVDIKYISIRFVKGVPVSLNGSPLSGLSLLDTLNNLAGKYGYGRVIYMGDCVIGIKGRILFEAPGLLTLIEAHKKLEQYCLTKKQIAFNLNPSATWADLVYDGLYYEPLVKNLEDYCNSVQRKVNGQVVIKLSLNNMEVVEVHAEDSLQDKELVTYAQKGSWTSEQVDGFIKFWGLQQYIAHHNENE